MGTSLEERASPDARSSKNVPDVSTGSSKNVPDERRISR
jgi:hypothetical protein